MKRRRQEATTPVDQGLPLASSQITSVLPSTPAQIKAILLSESPSSQIKSEQPDNISNLIPCLPPLPSPDLGESCDSPNNLQVLQHPPAQSDLSKADGLRQEQLQLLLQLDSQTAPPQRMQLMKGYLPYPQLLQTWQEQQSNPAVCGVRLIGNAERPDEYVGIAVQDLIAHSAWAATRLHQTDLQTSGLHTVLPICTPVSLVRRLVESLYSGFIELHLNSVTCLSVQRSRTVEGMVNCYCAAQKGALVLTASQPDPSGEHTNCTLFRSKLWKTHVLSTCYS